MACCKSSDKTVNTVFVFIFNCSVNLNWVCVVSKKTMRFGLDHRTCRWHLFQIFNFISAEREGVFICLLFCTFCARNKRHLLHSTSRFVIDWSYSDYPSHKRFSPSASNEADCISKDWMRSVLWKMKLWLTPSERVAVHGAVFWAHYTKRINAKTCHAFLTKPLYKHYIFMQGQIYIKALPSTFCENTWPFECLA